MTAHRIYLVRHAKAEKKAHSDTDRRLTPEGRSHFEAHACALAARMKLKSVVTSPFVRAKETAAILAGAAGVPVSEDHRLAPGASDGSEILALVREAPAGAALVGHNPEIAEAIATLAGRDLEVKPGAIAAVDVSGRAVSLAWLELPVK